MRTSVVILLASAALLAPSASTASSPQASLATFKGTWYGHTRYLQITAHGLAKESIGDGCCDPIIDLSFTLSNPRGTPHNATVMATVTQVHVRNKSEFSKSAPAPTVGETRVIRLYNGVITETLTGAKYCGDHAPSVCGA
jgi:hypothetical protein